VLPGRAPGLHLAEDGRKEAEATAERIAKLKAVAAVYSSPLERARETAEPIARLRGLEIRIEPGLIECEIGEWTGLELAKAAKLPEWTVVQRHPSGFRFPGGESFMEIQTRMADTLHALVARHPGETIVAVSHADPIKTAVAHALGTPLDLFQRIAISTASVIRHRLWPHRPHRAHRELHRRRPHRVLRLMAASFDFESPDFFTTGTVGVPGRRTFYLQGARDGQRGDAQAREGADPRPGGISRQAPQRPPQARGAAARHGAPRAGQRGLGGGLAGRGL
jgi:probable phosphoglycerate mutase